MHNMYSLFAIIPLFIYLGFIIFGLWFAISLIKAQRERNQILNEIARKLEKIGNKDL